LASKCIIATKAAESKTNHINDSIIKNNNIQNFKSFPFFGDKNGLRFQEDMINSVSAKIMLGNTEVSKEEAIEIVRSGGGGDNPSDTAIFVVDEDSGNLHMVFFSDKDNVNAIVAQSSLVAETGMKKQKIDEMVSNGMITEEDSIKIKTLMDESIKSYQQLETDLDEVVKGPIVHLQSMNPSELITIAKSLSKGANPAKYWSGDKNVRGISEFMSKSKKHMKYLPDNHSTPPTEEEMMVGFINYASDFENQLTKSEQRVLTELSNKTNGPRLGTQIGEICKKTIDTDLNLIKSLDNYKVQINGKDVGIGTMLEAYSVSEKLHFGIMFGGEGVYKDSDAFYQESGGVKVNKSAMEKCLPFSTKDDMISHFEVGEEKEMTKRGGTTITGASKIVYVISKDGKRYPIGEKKQRSKTGELGKLQTVYNYHPELQKCFKKNQ
jgi:polyhydroxyalkanoate synthesis regulator phasin